MRFKPVLTIKANTPYNNCSFNVYMYSILFERLCSVGKCLNFVICYKILLKALINNILNDRAELIKKCKMFLFKNLPISTEIF